MKKWWGTVLNSNRSLVDAAKGSYQGVASAYRDGMRSTSFSGLIGGTWKHNGKLWAGVGAGVGMGAGAVAGGEDHRVSGAMAGGLLGAGAGLAGAVGYNNRRGLSNMYRDAKWGAKKSWNKLDDALYDARYSRD